MATIRFEREGGKAVDEIQWQAQDLSITEKPNGPAAAAILASGIGVFVLGLLTTIAASSASFADDINIKNRVGPLSGKTTFAVIAWLVAWALLAPVLWKRDTPMNYVVGLTTVLIVAGLIGTFPKFYDLFA
jgi:hypothetical protein